MWWWLWISAGAQAGEKTLPSNEEPRALYADEQDRFYVDRGTRMVRWTTVADRTFTWETPKDWSTSSIEHAIAPQDGTIHTLHHISRQECNNKECDNPITYSKILLWTCKEDGRCDDRELASWSRRAKDKSYTSYDAEHLVTWQGTLLLTRTTTQVSSDGVKIQRDSTCGKKTCTEGELEEQYYEEMKVKPRYRIDPSDHSIYGTGLPRRLRPEEGAGLLAMMANVDTSEVYDGEGMPHVFFHQSGGRSFAHRHVEQGGEARVVEERIDGPESGASNAAVAVGAQGLLTFHYFYRNSYYKGVKATWFADAGQDASFQIDLASGRDDNPGWNLKAAATPQGRVLVGYTLDPKNGSGYTLRLFDSVVDIQKAALSEPQGWELKHKRWFGLVGAGGTLARWDYSTQVPDAEHIDLVEDPQQFMLKGRYDVQPALLLEGTAEARYGRFSLGASYAKQTVNDITREAGLSKAESERLTGAIGLDRIIKYHDIRIQLRQGRMTGRYSIAPKEEEGSPIQAEQGRLDSAYQRTDVYLLNTWRVRYGIVRQSSSTVLPFYAWSIAKGETEHHFAGAFISEAKITDTAFTVGYSRLDYAAKFENRVNSLFLDGDLGAGWSHAVLPRSYKVGGLNGGPSESFDEAVTFFLPFNAELGYIVLRRSYRLHGLGWYARGGYRGEGNLTGFNGRSTEPDEEAAESDDVTLSFNRTELRYGPFFTAGLVF